MYNRFLLLVSLLLVLSCKKQSQKIDESEILKLIEREKQHQDRAKYEDVSTIEVISDPNQVTKIRHEIEKKSIARELEQKQQQSLASRYKHGDVTVVKDIIRLLDSRGQSVEKLDIYLELAKSFEDPEDYQIREPELIAAILKKVKDTDDEKEAIQLAGIMELPGFAPAFEERLLSGQSKDEERLIYWLSRDGKSVRALDKVESLIFSGNVDLKESHELVGDLQGFAENGSPLIQKRVMDMCLKIIEKKLLKEEWYQEAKDQVVAFTNPVYQLSEVVYSQNDPRTIPFAKELLKRNINWRGTLRILVSIEGEKYSDQVFQQLGKKDQFVVSLELAKALYTAKPDNSIIDRVLAIFKEQGDYSRYVIDQTALALINMNERYFATKLNEVNFDEKLLRQFRTSYEVILSNPEKLASDLFAMGVVDQPISKEKIQKASASYSKEHIYAYIIPFLEAEGLLLYFDAEASVVPVRYDDLILQFSKASHGKFENVVVWMDYEEDIVNETIRYKVYLLANNKVYIGYPQALGDWYNVGFVAKLMNMALSEAGIKERYVFIDTGDQMVQFLFGPEDKVKQFALKYGFGN